MEFIKNDINELKLADIFGAILLVGILCVPVIFIFSLAVYPKLNPTIRYNDNLHRQKIVELENQRIKERLEYNKQMTDKDPSAWKVFVDNCNGVRRVAVATEEGEWVCAF